jgi:glycosyltransferase involved in cell wall biosynthesis
MVTTHPPTHCGIGAYGEQSIAQLRSQGHVVDVLSPDGQGNVDFAWDLRGGRKILRLLHVIRYYDRIVIQYHWAFFYRDLFYHRYRAENLAITLSFLWLFLSCRKIELVAHEIPYLTGRQRWLYGLKWKLASRVVLHTQAERQRFEQHYGRLSDARVELRKHHEVFRKFASEDKSSARGALRLPQGQRIFLCIGFIQQHKGYDRAIAAFMKADLADAALYIVGSLRYEDPKTRAYLSQLSALTRQSDRVHLVKSFVSNQEFDTWIIAADYVVIPYAEIWSSGVLARARLLARPAIVSSVGGLPEQAAECDLIFANDHEFVEALRTADGRIASGAVTA